MRHHGNLAKPEFLARTVNVWKRQKIMEKSLRATKDLIRHICSLSLVPYLQVFLRQKSLKHNIETA